MDKQNLTEPPTPPPFGRSGWKGLPFPTDGKQVRTPSPAPCPVSKPWTLPVNLSPTTAFSKTGTIWACLLRGDPESQGVHGEQSQKGGAGASREQRAGGKESGGPGSAAFSQQLQG